MSDEWFQQCDAEEWQRICSLEPWELDAELIAQGFTVEQLETFGKRCHQMVKKILAEYAERTDDENYC